MEVWVKEVRAGGTPVPRRLLWLSLPLWQQGRGVVEFAWEA